MGVSNTLVAKAEDIFCDVTSMRTMRWNYRRVALLSALLLSVLYVLSQLSWSHRGRQTDPMGGPDQKQRLTQYDLDSIAATLKVNYKVVTNSPSPHSPPFTVAQLTLTNAGEVRLPSFGWKIMFNSVHQIFVESMISQKSIQINYGLEISHINGELYSLTPTDAFGDALMPGEARVLKLHLKCCSIVVTDSIPNWYMTVPGLQPRLIKSTTGESFSFVEDRDTPETWKRDADPNSVQFDYFDPFTAETRYKTKGVADLGSAPIPVIPTPVEVSYDNSSRLNVFKGKWKLSVDKGKELKTEALYLGEIWGLPVSSESLSGEVIEFVREPVVVRVRDKELPQAECYELKVLPGQNPKIIIKASEPAGAFYAVQSLISITDRLGNVPATLIRDGPRFRYRGLMLDVARNFHSKETVFRYLDVMAMYKMNKLHLHLTDDEGWRLEIPGLPELTQIGGRRCHDMTGKNCLMPFLGSGPFANTSGSGYYTGEDYRAILRYATSRHIEVIPEIDMPGHCTAAIVAMEARYKRLRDAGRTSDALKYRLREPKANETNHYSVQRFNNNVLNPCLQSTFTFVETVINTVYSLHSDIAPLKVFHFGGDEVQRQSMGYTPSCDKLKATLDSTERYTGWQDFFARRVAKLLQTSDLDVAGWEDSFKHRRNPLPLELYPNRRVYAYTWQNSWEGGGAQMPYLLANSGYKVVMTPGTNLYLDHPQEPDPKERGLTWATRYIDVFSIFRLVPENIYWSADVNGNGVPVGICDDREVCIPLDKPENIEGIQGTMFGEYIREEWIVDYMVLPRLLAIAERGWHAADWEYNPSTPSREKEMHEDWRRFANTLGHKELLRLDLLGYNYRVPLPGAVFVDGELRTSVEFPGLGVEVSLDLGESWTLSKPGDKPVRGRQPILIRTRSADGKRFSRIVRVPGRKS
ncbi:beta-hexosaminidase [Aplysia californica]|uniref:beta-N-acetylhexosaminidase n=1 Tax=Aplysia californica TaxID=6500 RepID=A0ABM0JKP4_APLCA|nr:beta-hexosaminidase [Aplysia californica]